MKNFRISVTFLITTLFPFFAVCQCKVFVEADSLYTSGIAAYERKSYNIAIGSFLKCDSLNKAAERPMPFYSSNATEWAGSSYYLSGDEQKAKQLSPYCYRLIPVDQRLTIESDSLSYLAQFADLSKAVEYVNQCAKKEKTILGDNHYYYANSLAYISALKYMQKNYAEAYEYGEHALEIWQKNDPKSIYIDELYNLLLNICLDTKQFDSAAKYYKLKLEFCAADDPKFDEIIKAYDVFLYNTANFFSEKANYKRALYFAIKEANICKSIYGEKHPDYAQSMNNLASYYSSLGDYNKAIEFSTKAMNILKEVLGVAHPYYATSMSNLASYYSSLGDYNKAIEFSTKAMNILKEVLGVAHPYYATSLNNLASYYSSLGDYNKAIEFSTKALNIQKEVFGEAHPDYALSLNNLASYYSSLGDYNKSIEFGIKALNIRNEVLGESHPDYATSMSNLVMYYFYLGNYDKAEEYLSASREITFNNVVSNFGNLGAAQRNRYWNMLKWRFSDVNSYCLYAPDNASLYKTAYNSNLFSKGILLSSEVEFDKLIKKSGDTILLHKFEKLHKDLLQLDVYYKKPIADRPNQEVQRLEAEAETLEQALIKGSKEYGDFTRRLGIKWQDVQETLGDRDLAIEFVAPENDSLKRHMALILRKGWDAPKYVYIGAINEFDPYLAQGGELYNSKELSGKIWSQILGTAQIKEGDNIYFSPDGKFYQLAIEYLPTEDGRTMGEKYHIERLSSTKELCFREQNHKETSAVLYGGLKYNLDSNIMASVSRKYEISSKTRGDDFFKIYSSSIPADSLSRNSIKYLPGTLIEVENISSTLNDKGVEIKKYTAENGNEESFKALSGHTPQIIHVATHGFYLPPTEAELLSKRRQVSFLSLSDDQKTNVVDYSMSRTGLLFAGAQAAWSGRPLPENVDDGILTAKEISQLDLSNVDLAVLSACQTALGEITGDGVAGLQRGFKKAGVKTLVMSLWPVDDHATRIMMTAFYKNLTSGQSKREAFNSAMLALRNYEAEVEIEVDDTDQQKIYDETADDYVYPKRIIHEKRKPYTDPKYWATFIMLD